MADSTPYVDLNFVVNDLINELGAGKHKRFRNRYLQIAANGLTQLSLYHLSKYKQAWINVSDSLGTVAWPGDLVKWLSIGINIGGEYWTFTRDDSIIIPEGTVSGQDSLNSDRGENTVVDRNKSAAYGTRGGLNSNYFTVDEDNRRFVINGVDRDQVLVKYLSTGVNMSGASIVPIQAVQALKDFIIWRVSRQVKDYNTYAISVKDLRDLENSFTEDEFLDMIYKSTFRGVKRG